MNLRKILIIAGLTMSAGVGIAAGLNMAQGNEAIEAKANISTTAPFYIKGTPDEWAVHEMSTEISSFYFTGAENAITAYTYTYSNVGDDNKFYIYDSNENVLSGLFGGSGAYTPSGTWTWGNDMGLGNGHSGPYTFFIAKSINDFGDQSYGVSVLRKMGKTILTVTFADNVPDWANIYIPGTFNNWTLRDALMTRVNDTTFTYTLSSTYEFYQKWKIVADYAAHFDGTSGNPVWTHEVTTSNQEMQFNYSSTASDENPVQITANQNLSFTMTRDPLPEDAYLAIKFSSSVPESVKLYLGSSMFGWSNLKADAEFVEQAGTNRTEFRLDLTALGDVYAAAYSCQVVAMSAHNTWSYISYNHTVLGSTTITLSSSDAENVLAENLSYGNMSEIIALDFCDRFVSEIRGVCNYNGGTDPDDLTTAWGKYNTEYTGYAEGLQNMVKNANNSTRQYGSDFADFDELYVYVYSHYGVKLSLANFTGWDISNVGLSHADFVTAGNSSTALVIIVATVAVAALAGFGFFLLRRKEN